jgi:hypothetical protein
LKETKATGSNVFGSSNNCARSFLICFAWAYFRF